MRKYFFLIVLLTTNAHILIAQKKPTSKQKEKAPTQKEMQDMMKEMQQAMDGMSPEDKKMMDSMGIKMPDTKSIQKSISVVTDAQLKKAYEDDSRIVPLKDAARINAALAITLSKRRRNTSAGFKTKIFCCKYCCRIMDGWQTNTGTVSYGRSL